MSSCDSPCGVITLAVRSGIAGSGDEGARMSTSLAAAALIVAVSTTALGGGTVNPPVPDQDWEQIARLVPNGPPDTGMCAFGWDIDIKGDLAVVSSPFVWGEIDDNPGPHYPDVGAVWVFERIEGVWTQTQILRASVRQTSLFGWEAAIVGDSIIVTAPEESHWVISPNNPDGSPVFIARAGAFYEFRKLGAEWREHQRVQLDADWYNYAGSTLFILRRLHPMMGMSLAHNDGDTLVLGAPEAHWSDVNPGFDNSADSSGTVVVFKRNGDLWQFDEYIDPPNRASFNRFGTSVAVSPDGEYIAVGSAYEGNPSSGGNARPEVGYVNIFREHEGTDVYTHTQRFGREVVGPGLDIEYGYFGHDVEFAEVPNPFTRADELQLFVGAPGAEFDLRLDPDDPPQVLPASGAVDQFVLDPWFGQFLYRQHTIENPLPAAFDWFGEKIQIGDDRMMVGAWGADRDVNGDGIDEFDVGSAYMFYPALSVDTRDEDDPIFWRPRWSAVAADGVDEAYFGWPAVTDGNSILLASTNTDGCVGAAYIFGHKTGFPDLDGDQLRDDWELRGVPWHNAATLSSGRFALGVGNDGYADQEHADPVPFADPWRKDLFIEIDAAAGLASIKWKGLDIVRDAFADAPVPNPDGSNGIRLHYTAPADVEYVVGVPSPVQNSTAGVIALRDMFYGNQADFAGEEPNRAEILEAKRAAFRWAMFARELDGPAGWAHQPGDTLFLNGDYHDDSSFTTAKTFMHELGHSLGLGHGGADGVHYKPNYISVMNYNWYNFRVAFDPHDPIQKRIDFSREAIGVLDEADLDETTGILSAEYPRYLVPVPVDADQGGAPKPQWMWVTLNGEPVDWNQNGVVGESNVRADLNYLGLSYAGITQSGLPSPDELHIGHNDWAFPFHYAPVRVFARGTDGPVGDVDYRPELFAMLEKDIPPPPIPCNGADLAEPFYLLDLNDITTFIGAFVAQTPPADADGNGLYDLADITLFASAFLAGCP
jgi:hypothetical protein